MNHEFIPLVSLAKAARMTGLAPATLRKRVPIVARAGRFRFFRLSDVLALTDKRVRP